MKVSVSFIKSKHDEKETIRLIDETDADFLHVDFMDGKFVETENYTIKEISDLVYNSEKKLDVHLMCEDPIIYIERLAMLKTKYITFHLEAVEDIQPLINKIHSYGIKCGISIKPTTDIELLLPYIDKIQQVLIMSVEPGMGGQKFMPEVVSKLEYLEQYKNEHLIISVDGGINDETIEFVKDADMVVSGSYICQSDNYQEQINKLR